MSATMAVSPRFGALGINRRMDQWSAEQNVKFGNYSKFDPLTRLEATCSLYTIQNKLRTNCSQTCQSQSFELNDLKC